MKKLFFMILTVVMCVSLVACNNNKGIDNLNENIVKLEATINSLESELVKLETTIKTIEFEQNSSISETEDNTLKDSVIGTWVCEYQNSDGEEMRQTVQLYKGGTGRSDWFSITKNRSGSGGYIKWEMENEMIIATYSGGQMYLGFEYDVKSDTLIKMEGKRVFVRE